MLVFVLIFAVLRQRMRRRQSSRALRAAEGRGENCESTASCRCGMRRGMRRWTGTHSCGSQPPVLWSPRTAAGEGVLRLATRILGHHHLLPSAASVSITGLPSKPSSVILSPVFLGFPICQSKRFPSCGSRALETLRDDALGDDYFPYLTILSLLAHDLFPRGLTDALGLVLRA